MLINVPLTAKFKDSSNNSIKYDFKTDSFTINVPTVQMWGAVYVDYQIFSGGYEVPTLNNTYTKTQVDNAVASKANQSTTYTKTEVDNALILKANTTDINTCYSHLVFRHNGL